MTNTINIVKCQSGDMVSTIITDQPIQFRHDNKVMVVEKETGKMFFLFPSDIKYITPAIIESVK